MIMLQSWRANCDVKILLYDTDPAYPDIREIENVSGYVVSYTCKGHLTVKQEKDIICESIRNTEAPGYDGKDEVSYVSKNALNALSGRRIIGQPETHHSCINLPLTLCSENLVGIRISGWSKLPTKTLIYGKNSTDFVTKYYMRQQYFDKSLWQFFDLLHDIKNQDQQLSIPYATGGQSTPIYPITASYARASLIKHKPWSRQNMINFRSDDEDKQQFHNFCNSPQCPSILKTELKRLKKCHENNNKRREPTNSNIDPSNTSHDFIDDNDEDFEDLNISSVNKLLQPTDLYSEYNGHKFEKGLNYHWAKRSSDRDPDLNGDKWLFQQIDEYKNQCQQNNSMVNIPLKKMEMLIVILI